MSDYQGIIDETPGLIEKVEGWKPNTTRVSLTALPQGTLTPSSRVAGLLSAVSTWERSSGRYPNLPVLFAGKEPPDQRNMRLFQSEVHRHIGLMSVDASESHPLAVAADMQGVYKRMTDRSGKRPETKDYTKAYYDYLEAAERRLKAKGVRYTKTSLAEYADQPGVKRLLSYSTFDALNGKQYDPSYTDLLWLDFFLFAGAWAEATLFMKANTHLKACAAAYKIGLEICNDMHKRWSRLAEIKTGDPEALHKAVHILFHPVCGAASYCSRMYQITGERKWLEHAKRLWGYVLPQLYPLTLPGGEEGWVTTHNVSALSKAQGGSGSAGGWHNAVYLGDGSGSRPLIHALLNEAFGDTGGFTFDHARQLGNTLFYTLPQYGWSDARMARDMGGGGSTLPSAKRLGRVKFAGKEPVQTGHPGSLVGTDDDGKPATDAMIVCQRSPVLFCAPYSDLWQKWQPILEGLDKTSSGGRGMPKTVLVMIGARKEGKLVGAG